MKKVCVFPFYKSWENPAYFDFFGIDNPYNFPSVLKSEMEGLGYSVELPSNSKIAQTDYIVLFRLNPVLVVRLLLVGKLGKCVYIPFEPSAVDELHDDVILRNVSRFIPTILTWQDTLIGERGFTKFHTPVTHLDIIENDRPFLQRKLITTIVGNKASKHPDELYSARRELIDYLDKHYANDFNFYGVGWDGCGYPSYKGSVESKFDVLKNYKFCICYENQKDAKGLVSEKIFDAFRAGVVPIFLGATNISEYIPESAFIDRRKFSTDAELVTFLSTMLEHEHNTYLASAKAFYSSKAIRVFSCDNFAKTVLSAMSPLDNSFNIKKIAIVKYVGHYCVSKFRKALNKLGEAIF